MTKANLTEAVSEATEMPSQEADEIVCAIFDVIVGALQRGDKVEIRGFGAFRTRTRRARIGRNPKTGARVEIPSKKVAFFRPG